MFPFFNLGGIALQALSKLPSLLRKQVSVSTVLLVLALSGVAIYAFMQHERANSSEELAGWMVQLNDSTQAKIVRREQEHRNALNEAAKKLNGKLVAGVEIHVKPDTIFVPVTEVISSTVLPDSTREAVLVDSTSHKGYKIEVTTVAPPFPANLKIGYSLTTPAFNPTVGFVKTGSSYAAVVSWVDEKFTVDNAFFVPAERREPSLSLTAEAGTAYSLAKEEKGWQPLYVGLSMNYKQVFISGYVDATMERPTLYMGYSKTLWSH